MIQFREAELQSPVMQKIAAEMQERIAYLHVKIAMPVNIDVTNELRGSIKECKRLLALVSPTPAKAASDSTEPDAW
jgi:hypothetical protein